MVPGITVRDAQAAELRRIELLALVERERARSHDIGRGTAAHGEWARRLGTALVRAGGRLRIAASPAARATGGPIKRLPDRL